MNTTNQNRLVTFCIVVLTVLVAILTAFTASQAVYGQEAAPLPADDPGYMLIYGGRLQSDMLFYGQFGVKGETYDVSMGIGWNNSIWLGGHNYFFSGDGIAAFSGLELHIEYPENGTLTLAPALPLGFAVQHEKTVWIVEALILPALKGEPVTAIFALSFLFGL